MSSSSSSSAPQWIYDVFLSFRGEDTRLTFVAHLYNALKTAGINIYIDNQLQKGTNLGPELYKAIDGSRFSIVVFSKNYTGSSWCLKELEHIMNRCEYHGQVVVPIFYHVDPSDVRSETSAYRKAMKETLKRRSSGEKRMGTVLSSWATALTVVGSLSGWVINEISNEGELMPQIVNDFLRKLKSRLLKITEYPVGLDTRVQQVIQFIENQSNKQVCLIGIWGMGGSGKTTTARAIFNEINLQQKFVNLSFIEDIREACKNGKNEIIHLQEQLLSDILKTSEKINNPASGITTIEKRFNGKKVFIVLDGVSTSEQVKALCGNHKDFGWGSVLIVTSRNVRILRLLNVDHVYRINTMDTTKSIELFSWHAFRKQSPDEDFRELSETIVDYCGGLPLALQVIGSLLHQRTIKQWNYTISKLKRIPNDTVQKKLKLSYDGLADDEQYIFLDICCFFIGKDISNVTEILNGCGLFADTGITDLIEQSLLKVEKNNKIGMHGLIRAMGREIERKRSKYEPGERIQWWFPKDVHSVLTDNSGTKTVEGLVLKLESNSNVSFKANSFKEMENLKLLQLGRVDFTEAYVHLSKNLVVFKLKHSNIQQVWSDTKLMEKLKILNLSHSKYLTSTPDFSELPNLEKLIMKNCPCLSEVHRSIGDLRNLLLINLKDCTDLSCLPESINQLKSLTTLILSGCSKIGKLEEGIVQMKSLTTLAINGTGVKEVRYSVVRLNSIGYISLRGYKGLSQDVLHSFIRSWMSPTMDTEDISLCGYNSDFLTPIVSSLQQLRTVWIQCHSEDQLTQELKIIFDQCDINSTETEELQNPDDSLSSHLIGMRSCPTVMDTLGKSRSQGLKTTNDSSIFFLPGGNHPSCLAYSGEGPSAQFQVPMDIDCRMEGIVLRVVYSSTYENMAAECLTSVLIVNYTKCTIHIYKRDTIMSFNDEDWKNLTSNLGPGDDVKICVAFRHGSIVKKTIVYLVSGQSIIVEVDDANMEVVPPEEVDRQPSPEVEVQESANPNESIFKRLPNRIGAFLRSKRHKGLNNF